MNVGEYWIMLMRYCCIVGCIDIKIQIVFFNVFFSFCEFFLSLLDRNIVMVYYLYIDVFKLCCLVDVFLFWVWLRWCKLQFINWWCSVGNFQKFMDGCYRFVGVWNYLSQFLKGVQFSFDDNIWVYGLICGKQYC